MNEKFLPLLARNGRKPLYSDKFRRKLTRFSSVFRTSRPSDYSVRCKLHTGMRAGFAPQIPDCSGGSEIKNWRRHQNDASIVYADQSNHELFEQVAFLDLFDLHCAERQAKHTADFSYVSSFLPRFTVRQQIVAGIRNRLV